MSDNLKQPGDQKPVLKQGLRRRISSLTSPSIRQPKKDQDCNCGKRKPTVNDQQNTK
jgi:hypothetical protein